jgi:hypothetical protein
MQTNGAVWDVSIPVTGAAATGVAAAAAARATAWTVK